MKLLLILVILFNLYTINSACKGCISLDEYNINKVISKFKAVVVKFDIAFPYGEKHDSYVSFAGENTKHDDLIFADVGIKDYGDRDNEKLAQKFNINNKDDLPVVMLFKKDIDNPILFKEKVTIENLRDFVRDHTDFYIGLPGCDEKYDKIAFDFMNNMADDGKYNVKLLAAMEKEEDNVAKTYAKYMKKIHETGSEFVEHESKRLNKIIKDSKINEEKKKALLLNLNILKSFKQKLIEKDEL